MQLTPQYLFPSQLNDLHPDRSSPYAFNHHTLSFHWTRADALADTSWNIWARPPCLNCVVACEGDGDGDLVRRCDFGERRDRTFGRIQSCSRCLSRGLAHLCVEQIEVRTDGSISASEEDLQGRDPPTATWSQRERRLRRQGVVQWRPINLHMGDVEAKKAIVDISDHQQESVLLYGDKRNWILPARPSLPSAAASASAAAITRARLSLDIETQDAKALRLCRAAGRVAEWDGEDLLLRNRTAANKPEFSFPTPTAPTQTRSYTPTVTNLDLEIDRTLANLLKNESSTITTTTDRILNPQTSYHWLRSRTVGKNATRLRPPLARPSTTPLHRERSRARGRLD